MTPSTEAMTLRLDPDLAEDLEIVAWARRVPVIQVVRDAIEERLQTRGLPVHGRALSDVHAHEGTDGVSADGDITRATGSLSRRT